MNRSQRTNIAKQTLEILEQGYYDTASGPHIAVKDQLAQSIADSKLYTPEDLATLALPPIDAGNLTSHTRFRVENATTLDVAHSLVNEENGKVLCLNFASAKNPGGGFLNGSQAQEESLARSSCLYPTLLQHETYYKKNRAGGTCLYTDNMTFSPAVLVIRDDEGTLLEAPYTVSFVTAPAVNAGAVRRSEPHNVNRIIPVMRQRMQYVLNVCVHEGYRNLVLGAWGCGVFMNEPDTIADLWYTLLVDNKTFRHRFDTVVFAVLDRQQRGTFSAFEKRFKALLH
jgi:uncharacterized protein (TIGR02452 family)